MIQITFNYPADVAEVQKLLFGDKVQPPKATVTALPTQASKPAAKPAAKPTEEGGMDYERDVKPLAMKLSKNPVLRPKLLAIWKELGVSVGGELTKEQLPQAKEKIEAVIAENP